MKKTYRPGEKVILRFLIQYGWLYLIGIAFLLLNSRTKTMLPEALGEAIDLLRVDTSTAKEVYWKAASILFIAILVFATQFVWRICIIRNARKLECYLREQYFLKLQSLPLSFFSRQRSGDLMAYAINDVGAVRMTFGPVLAMGISGIMTALLSVVSMIEDVDGRLTLFALLPVPVAVVAIVYLGSVVRTRFRRVQELFSNISGFVNESIMGIRVIKTFAKEKQWTEDFDGISKKMRDANVDLTKVSSLIGPSVTVAFGISYVISLIYGGHMVMNGQMGLGDLVAFQGYLTLIQMPVVSLGRIINMIQRGLASYKRLRTVFDEKGIEDKEFAPYEKEIRGEIEAKNLTFRYDGMENPALKEISFHLPAGGTLGIAGTTGCGKTTLAHLLMKFYDTPRGMLFVDGVDINDIPAYALRQQIGYVSQDGFLFSTSIEENVRFYQPDTPLEKVREATALANIDKEITEFPEQYNTEVGERGTHLSGGQKQRISLARALVRDPQILILDDTLSAVDNVTEKRITEHLSGVLKDKTSIVISHRLSALQEADLILFMDDGKILECGTHQQLMEQNGVYAQTYLKQFEKGAEENA